ncbi:MAG: haloacid dehalogenase, partial [Acinetobacter sp.]|nr:haloacid dehalogenase [Acinetobacter sp.]
QLNIKHNLFKQYQNDLNPETIELSDETALNEKQEQQITHCLEDMRGQFQTGQFLQNMDLILFHSETDMPIYVENRSPLLSKMRQMILVDQISEIQIIKNRLWNGCHAMLAWYASALGHDTIGIAMADPKIMKYAEQVVNEVKLGLANMIPNQAKELDRMAESFLHSCRAAYKDPCERVARDPLRKLNLNERVLGSLESHVQQQLPYQKLMQGAIYGYAYALKMLGLDEIKIVKHVQTNIEHMDITENQKKALLNQLYHGIQAELNDNAFMSQLEELKPLTA